MSDADCTPGREPRSVAASLKLCLLLRYKHTEVKLTMTTCRYLPRSQQDCLVWWQCVVMRTAVMILSHDSFHWVSKNLLRRRH